MQHSSVALIRSAPEGVHYTLLAQRGDALVRTSHGIIPKWNMKDIPPERNVFRIPENREEEFLKVLKSEEGKKVINDLKNRKTDEVINLYLKKEEQTCLDCIEKDQTLLRKSNKSYLGLIRSMIPEALVGDNQLSQQKLHITREDIYREFISKGLLKS